MSGAIHGATLHCDLGHLPPDSVAFRRVVRGSKEIWIGNHEIRIYDKRRLSRYRSQGVQYVPDPVFALREEVAQGGRGTDLVGFETVFGPVVTGRVFTTRTWVGCPKQPTREELFCAAVLHGATEHDVARAFNMDAVEAVRLSVEENLLKDALGGEAGIAAAVMPGSADPGQWAPSAPVVVHDEAILPGLCYEPDILKGWQRVERMVQSMGFALFREPINCAVSAFWPTHQ